MIRRRFTVSALACAAVLLVGACSDGGGGDDGGGDASSVPDTPVSTSMPSALTPSSASPTDSSPTRSSRPQPPTLPPPYVEGADWVDTEVGPSLQIRPTRNGRNVSGDTTGAEAWNEVLALYPDADSPGMRAQFDCHWTFARLVDPEKPSWNLEPDRPVVTESEMISARCNPGFAEEQ
ncbi:DUF2599 domain-containing protein [Gordonia sp. HY002]|uniref:DUF2599 domain-containing protein n=1 Tax=Gordonia zhenghanii TaxID=2911516 RepID=UPI001EF047FA|nr:DUF2599 domain-containing protein [Gordonia zhenghanii]MCF8570019.1 DUF2599 domain-containing protein [Gordonia zhenghanii]MCF8607094.1 DUF2599 domain-containing protein [Gordonia zhenghanii]